MFTLIKTNLLNYGKLLMTSVLTITLMSCASTTTIRAIDSSDSTDRDVKIYLDGSYKGRGKIIHSDMKIVGSTTNVKFRKKGCQSNRYSFSRSEQLHVGALIGGIFFLFPFLWIMGYNPIHSYEFRCEGN